MKIALCNEVIREMTFAAQCDFAAALGYDGIELAPFTLGDEPHLMPAAQRREIRAAAATAGMEIVSLHWLLVTPKGLSITTADVAVRARTIEIMRRLIGLCAELDGRVLVHGSPGQRALDPADGQGSRARGRDAFAAIAEAAEQAGVVYCIEPLAPVETDFINTVDQAAELVNAIGSPAVRTMVDCSATAASESEPVAALLARWLPSGKIAHVQVNDRNRRGPGEGGDRFAPVFAALRRHGYTGAVAVEPFLYQPDGPACAARAIGYIRGIIEGLDG